MNIQIITSPTGEQMAVLPMADLEVLLAAAAMDEEQVDMLAAETVMQRVREGREEVFPGELIHTLSAGANPVQAIRKYRRMTQQDLASAVGINPVYLSQIERGTRTGSVETLAALAKALRVDMELLAGWRG